MNPMKYVALWGIDCKKDWRWTLTCAAQKCDNAALQVNVSQEKFLLGLYEAGWRLVSHDGNEPKPECPECIDQHHRLKRQVETTAISLITPEGKALLNDENTGSPGEERFQVGEERKAVYPVDREEIKVAVIEQLVENERYERSSGDDDPDS